jgi:hypothetical protein
LVLKAQIGTYNVDRVFRDAGSGINLIYAKTLREMHISLFLVHNSLYGHSEEVHSGLRGSSGA